MFIAIKREEKKLNAYRDDIDRTRWLTCQHVEIVSMGPDFILPRIIVGVFILIIILSYNC